VAEFRHPQHPVPQLPLLRLASTAKRTVMRGWLLRLARGRVGVLPTFGASQATMAGQMVRWSDAWIVTVPPQWNVTCRVLPAHRLLEPGRPQPQ
jgi:hypothetical protein